MLDTGKISQRAGVNPDQFKMQITYIAGPFWRAVKIE